MHSRLRFLWWVQGPVVRALTNATTGPDLCLSALQAGKYLWSHQVWSIHVHDALSVTSDIRFQHWHVGLGRFILRSGLLVAPGLADVGDGACRDQSYLPDALLWGSMVDSSPAVPPDHASPFSGRFAAMAGACPAAHTSQGPLACCGRVRRRCGGSQAQHNRVCFGTWQAIQLAIGTLNRTALLQDPFMRDTMEHESHQKFLAPV